MRLTWIVACLLQGQCWVQRLFRQCLAGGRNNNNNNNDDDDDDYDGYDNLDWPVSS